MRKRNLQLAVSIFVLACGGRAAAESEPTPPPAPATAPPAPQSPPPAPQSPPPPAPTGAPPPVAPVRPDEAAPPAGPEAPPQPPPALPGARVRPRSAPARAAEEIQFDPSPRDTTLLIMQQEMPVYGWGYRYGWWGPYRGFARSYTPVCTGPCSARFAPGAYELALAKGGRIARSPGRVMITQPSVIKGEYLDRSGVRLAGILIGVGGLIGGTIMMVESVHRHDICDANYCYYHEDVDGALLAGGVALAVGSAIAGSIMAWQRDEAVFTILPLRMGSLFPAERGSVAQRALPQGAAVAVRF